MGHNTPVTANTYDATFPYIILILELEDLINMEESMDLSVLVCFRV